MYLEVLQALLERPGFSKLHLATKNQIMKNNFLQHQNGRTENIYYKYLYTYICVYTYIHMYIHIYVCVYTHTCMFEIVFQGCDVKCISYCAYNKVLKSLLQFPSFLMFSFSLPLKQCPSSRGRYSLLLSYFHVTLVVKDVPQLPSSFPFSFLPQTHAFTAMYPRET